MSHVDLAYETCPKCAHATMSQHDASPWCPACEWNLDRYERGRSRATFGIPLLDRWAHRLAYRLGDRQFRALAGRPAGRPGWTVARVTLTVASMLLLAITAACLAVGGWLTAYRFPSLTIIPGMTLVLLAIALRPRFGRLDRDAETLERSQVPELFALIDRVAEAISAPLPHVVTISTEFNATAGVYGLRRQRVLSLGLPLWAVLGPQERVALLGHELGHFVNGDLRRMLLTQPAYTTLANLAILLRPRRQASRSSRSSLFLMLAEVMMFMVQFVLTRLLWLGQLVLVLIGQREAQRAEYFADALAARCAGTEAAVRLTDLLVRSVPVAVTVRASARGGAEAAVWRVRVAEFLSASNHELAWRRQLSQRNEAYIFASHPSSGLRAKMIESRPWMPALVTLPEAASERIDAELAPLYQRKRRAIGWE